SDSRPVRVLLPFPPVHLDSLPAKMAGAGAVSADSYHPGNVGYVDFMRLPRRLRQRPARAAINAWLRAVGRPGVSVGGASPDGRAAAPSSDPSRHFRSE